MKKMQSRSPNRLNQFLRILISTWLMIALMSPIASAELKMLMDNELREVTGAGIADFTINGNSARLFLDIHIETYAEIDSFKTGFYEKSDFETKKYNSSLWYSETNNNYATQKGAYGLPMYSGLQGSGTNSNTKDWDINWTQVQMGTDIDNPAVIDGLILRLDFDDIGSTSNRQLQRVVFGTNSYKGNLSAQFNRTSGLVNPEIINDPLISQTTSEPILLKRDSFLSNWNNRGLNFSGDNTGLFFAINLDAANSRQGFEVMAGYNEQFLNFDHRGEWWDKL